MQRADRTSSRRRKHRAATRRASRPQPTVEITDYRHKAEKRRNNPDAGLASYNYRPQERVKYSYDPHLDPQLVWAGKADRTSFELETVSLHIHERVSTQAILTSVQRADRERQLKLFAEPDLPLDRRIEFYQHEVEWANRLILGDSLLVMNSLIERELIETKVQMVYMDPPYGINYASNFQPRIGKRDVKDIDEDLTREPEQIKAYRDTWTLGVHSYLTYLRDRLLLCRRLLRDSGSIFVQISDENVHHVRELLDEVFGSKNFCALITFRKKMMPLGSDVAESVSDYLLWYARDRERVKTRPLFRRKPPEGDPSWSCVELPNGTRRRMTRQEIFNNRVLPVGSRIFQPISMLPAQYRPNQDFTLTYEGKTYNPPKKSCWKTDRPGMERLLQAKRLYPSGDTLRYVLYHDDYPVSRITNLWDDTSGADDPMYPVQTNTHVIQRCMLMTTDPGDLVFDPTCGAGTTAYVAERWGRRWITCDTSRVAIFLARQRLMTAKFDYYRLANPNIGVGAGFECETVPHITLKSIAQNEPPETEILHDRPRVDHGRVRVSGPFTVEGIPVPVLEEQAQPNATVEGIAIDHMNIMLEMLQKDGITFLGGRKMMLAGLRLISSAGFLHAEGEAAQNDESIRVAVSFGPRYAPITARQVDEAIRSSYRLGFDALVLAGFAFDPEAQATIQKNPIPRLKVHMAHISPDVIVGDLLKTTKGSQLFAVFGEPDIEIKKTASGFVVRLLGVDVYDPTTGEVQSTSAEGIRAWFLDEDYDGYTFRICQAFFPEEATAKNPWDKLENALRAVIDREKMEMFRGTESLPFEAGSEKRIAAKVIDSRGNEVMVVRSLGNRKE